LDIISYPFFGRDRGNDIISSKKDMSVLCPKPKMDKFFWKMRHCELEETELKVRFIFCSSMAVPIELAR
jgi:hypothetical protein